MPRRLGAREAPGVGARCSRGATGCGFASGWCVAKHGTIVRYYSYYGDGELEVGKPLPAEQGYLLPHQISDAPDDADICHAPQIAAHISVDPATIGPHTPHGRTPCHGPHPGRAG